MTATEAASPALVLRDLYRFYRAGDDETLALRGVSLTVNAGELVALVGPSGSGKSTLLACAGGLDDPDGGSVWVGGERMSHRDEEDRCATRARRVGLLFQSANLLEHLTIRANLALCQRLAGNKADARTRELLLAVGLEHRSKAYPSQLSGGELARAGIAVALVNRPDVVLADEPTGELDEETETVVLTLLRNYADQGGAILVGSHSPAVARSADRVVQLRDGVVISVTP